LLGEGEEVLLDGGESLLLGEGEEVLLDGGESLLLGEGEEVLLDGGESLLGEGEYCSMAAVTVLGEGESTARWRRSHYYSVKVRKYCSMAASHYYSVKVRKYCSMAAVLLLGEGRKYCSVKVRSTARWRRVTIAR